MQIDHLITSDWIIPIVPHNQVLDRHAIAITDGKIVGLCPIDEAEKQFVWQNRTDLGEQVLLPGLINAHGHSAMSLFRGMADDFALMDWLENHIWPAEQQWVDAEFVRDGVELAIAEMLLSGTTCFHDMYFFPEVSAKIAKESGMRALVTFPIFDFPSAWGSGPDDYFAKGTALIEQYQGDSHIQIGFGPHAPYTVSDEALKRLAELSQQYPVPVQMHVHETAFEVDSAIESSGIRPLERLQRLGLLNNRFQAVHMTQISDRDIALLQQTGAHVIHCPESNLKLASGFSPIQKLLNAGVNVAIGTDGAASNNDLDLFGEIKTAALIAKAVTNDATALNAHQALQMATINGAKAMGIADKTGSLEVGKQADMIAVDLSALAMQPVYDPTSHLVYSNAGSQVSHVWVDGKALVKDGQLTQMDTQAIKQKARQWQQKIRASNQ